MELGNERVVIDRERAARIAAERDFAGHCHGGATPCSRFEDHQAADAAGTAFLRLA